MLCWLHLTDTRAVSMALENYRRVAVLGTGQGQAAEKENLENDLEGGAGHRLRWD